MLMPRAPYDTNSEPGSCDNTRGWNVMCKVQRSCGQRALSYNIPKKRVVPQVCVYRK